MNHRTLATIGSLTLHAALLGALSAAVATIPVQISFQRGRATIELQASVAVAPRSDPEKFETKIEAKRPIQEKVPKLEPTEAELERRPAEPPKPEKPDADEPLPPETPAEKVEPVRPPPPDEQVVEVEVEPPPRRLKQATPRDLEAPEESLAQAASQAIEGTVYDDPPQPHHLNRQPPYPADAYSRRQQGTVVLHLRVLTDGTVGDVRIAVSSGIASLDEAAVEAARNWRYTPARRGGTSIAMTFQTRVNFSIRG